MTDRTGPAARPRGGRRDAILIAASLVALAGAGGVLWATYREDLARLMRPVAVAPKAARPATPDGRPLGDDEPAFWTDVSVYKAGPGRPVPVMVARRGKQPTAADESIHHGLLARELVRQALLVSAREELGALTRDVPIGDPEVEGRPDVTFRIGSRFRMGYGSTDDDRAAGRITIVEGVGAGRRVVWAEEFPCAMRISPDYEWLVRIVGGFSRGPFRKALEGLGVARVATPKPGVDGGGLPEGVEARLGKLAEEEQFAAIRALHAAIRERGEGPTLLVGLARGYATLGSLAESQWTADGDAFKARALLYAERAAARDPESPAILRGRAYAETVAGLFLPALEDLARADKADGGKEAPAWAPIIRAYARSDAGTLADLAKQRPDDPWPLYFRSLAVSRASGYLDNLPWVCRGEIVQAARDALEKAPGCFRLIDGMASASGVPNLHTATTIGLEAYPRAIRDRVAAVPGLPAGVVDRADEVAIRGRLVTASAVDGSDLTWGVLARQFREIRFLLACRRIHFLAGPLGADASDFAAEVLPLLADHPNRAYVEGWANSFAGADPRPMLRGLDLADIEPKAVDLLRVIRQIEPDLYKRLLGLKWEHINDGTVLGHELRLRGTTERWRRDMAVNLLKNDPESPIARGALIFTDWDRARPEAEAWEKDHGGGDTVVIAQLGLRSLQEVKLDDAIARLEKALARSPESWIFEGLAEAYRRGDRMDRWVEAVGAFLKTEDMGLDHAKVVGNLADYLIEKGRFDKARPFAEISAESGAAWAMLQAAQCAEGTGDFEAAERWVARTSLRYERSGFAWYYWCKRTGKGDLRAAKGLIETRLAAGRGVASDDDQRGLIYYSLLEGRPDRARELLESRLNRKADGLDGILLALAHDSLGDSPARDAALKAVNEDPRPIGPKTAASIASLLDWMAKGKPEPFDGARTEAIINGIEPDHRPNSWALVGLLLDRLGRPEDAIPYLKRADAPGCHEWSRLLARDALRARGIEAAPFPF